MSFFISNSIVFLFLYTILGLSEKDIELIEKLQISQYMSYIDIFDTKYNTISYDIHLHRKAENGILGEIVPSYQSENNTYKTVSIEMDDETQVSNLIHELKRTTTFNYNIRFYYKNYKRELIKFVKKFMKELEMNQIDKVDVRYNYDGNDYRFYEDEEFYMESIDDSLVIKERRFRDSGSVYLEIRTITNDYIRFLLSKYYKLFFKTVKNPEKKKLLQEYFFNEKLLFMDKNSLVEEGSCLNECSVEEKDFKIFTNDGEELGDFPDMRYLNILFYFLKDSDVLKRFVLTVLNNYQSEQYILFRKITEGLKIDFEDGYEPFLSKEEGLNFDLVDLNDSWIVESVCDRIRMINMEKYIENYKKFLLFFFYYLKCEHNVKVYKLLELIGDEIIGSDINKKNRKVLRKLMKYLSSICDDLKYSKCFIFDIYDEKEKVYF